MNFIDHMNHTALRSNMTSINHNTYIVGCFQVTMPSAEQRAALNHDGDATLFNRLFKDGVLYYSTSYRRSLDCKRNNTICSFRKEASDSLSFGQIEVFSLDPKPAALLRKLEPLTTSLINQAGHPCRPSLSLYQEIDLLSSFIIPVQLPSARSILLSIPLDEYVFSKAVLVSASGTDYAVSMPNPFERH